MGKIITKIGHLASRFWQQLAVIVFVALGVWLYFWYFYDYPYTRDAYVYANVTNIASNVSGPIQQVFAKNNQSVIAGQRLFEIDPAPYQYALNKAEAALLQAKANASQIKTSVKEVSALVSQKRAALNNAQDHLHRLRQLHLQKAISDMSFVNAQTEVKLAESELQSAQQQLLIAKQRVNNDELLAAQANYRTAQYELLHTTIKAPENGYVTNFRLVTGDYVKSGEPLFALVDTGQWWVEARFRETLVRLLKPGQSVNVSLDMYPGVTFHGVIESIGWGINRRQSSPDAAPSTLVYSTPTEDWIRMTQRFPIQIAVTPQKKYPFRVGASARVLVQLP